MQRAVGPVAGVEDPEDSKNAVAFPLRIENSSRTVNDDERRGLQGEAGELGEIIFRRKQGGMDYRERVLHVVNRHSLVVYVGDVRPAFVLGHQDIVTRSTLPYRVRQVGLLVERVVETEADCIVG